MDNLTRLKLTLGTVLKDLKQMDSIEFPNLKRLSIDLVMHSDQVRLISKLRFPNLEITLIHYGLFCTGIGIEASYEDQSIFRLFNNVKELHCINFPLTQHILSYNNLTKLRFACNKIKYEVKLKSFDIIIKHKSLREIIIDEIIIYNENEHNNLVVDRIDYMKIVKSNAKISVSIKKMFDL